jgi:MoxR-like ATPase
VDRPEDSPSISDPVRDIDDAGRLAGAIRRDLGQCIHGQQAVIESLLTALFAGGHALLVGVPGLAKTLIVRSLAGTLGLSFRRIQFTPDLMPSDITGTDILQEDAEGRRHLEFVRGPVFANVVLADEINRAPPKTQSALLEAMQEHHVTVAGRTYPLGEPFFVLATQNPIEQEGTYPLPEAQLDRFTVLVRVGYPSAAEELAIARLTTGTPQPLPGPVAAGADIGRLQAAVRRLPVPEHLYAYAVRLVRASRPGPEAASWVRAALAWGAGPRALQHLVLSAKARAALAGSYLVRLEDLRAVAPDVLEHRLILTFQAESEGLTGRGLVLRLLEEVSAEG